MNIYMQGDREELAFQKEKRSTRCPCTRLIHKRSNFLLSQYIKNAEIPPLMYQGNSATPGLEVEISVG